MFKRMFKSNKTKEEENKLLRVWCNKGDIEKVEELISLGAEINGKDEFNGYTPLINAIIGNNIEIIRLLMNSGASVTSVDENGKTPLIYAIINNNIEAMKILLNNINVNINKAYDPGERPIDYAFEQDNIEAIYLLLEKNVKLDLAADSILLRHASSIGHFGTVKILLENYKTSKETTDTEDRTPLCLASKYGNLEIVKYLLEKGADIEAKDKNGMSPLILASKNGNLEIVKYLFEKGVNVEAIDKEERTCLMIASIKGHLNIVEFLLEKGADIEAKNKKGETALIKASLAGHLDIAEFLLNCYSNEKIRKLKMYSIMISALEYDNKELVKYLLDNETAIDVLNENIINKISKLLFNLDVKNIYESIKYGSLEILNLLMKNGINIEFPNEENETPLIYASKIGSLEIVKLLLNNGANIEAKNKLDRTSLMEASRGGHIDTIKFLLDRGANIEAKDIDGGTSLIEASRCGHVDTVKYLLDRGANIDAETNRGLNAYIVAAFRNNLNIMELLLEYGVNINGKNKNGTSYLEILLMHKDPLDSFDVINFLITKGINIDLDDEWIVEKLTYILFQIEIKNIYEAVIQNEFDIVKFFVSNGVDIKKNYHKFTLLELSAFLGHKNILDYLLSFDDNNSLFKNVVDRIIIGGFENVTLFIDIDNCSKKPLYYELAYTLESDKYIDWKNKTNEIQKNLGLKNIELFERDGLYYVKVFNNTNESKLICSLLIDSKKPDFIDFIEQNYTSYFLFKSIPGVSIDAWNNQKLYIEDILGLPVDIEIYDNLHSLWGKFGFEQLILIKESNISVMPDHFEIGGRYLKMNIEDGFKQYYFVDVLDYELWLDKKEEITEFLDFNFEIKKINDGVILKESVENSLPRLLELQDSHKNYPQLYCVKTDGKNKAYYYTFLPEISLKNWKEQAKKKSFRTLFNQPDKVYKLDVYDKSNKELYDENFYKGQLIILNEYEEIPLKDTLGELSEKTLVKDKVFWGYGSGSKLYYTSIDDLSHFMIIGATGSGKSNFMNGIILSLMNSVESIQKMFLIDLKSGIEFNRYKDLGSDKIEVFTRGTKPSNLLSALYEIEAEMYLREEYMLNNSITKITKDPIFVIIDEFAQIDLMNSSTPDERKSKDEIFNVLLRIGTRSRSANIKLFIQTQDPRSVPEDLKKHLMSRALLKTGKDGDKDLTLQNPDMLYEQGIVHTKFDKGRYVFEDYNDGDTKLNELQFPFLDPKKELHLLFKNNARIHSENIKNKYEKYVEFVCNEYKYLGDTKLLSSFNKSEKIEKKSFEQKSNTKNEADPIIDEFDFDSLLNDSEEKEDLFENDFLEINKTYLESKKLLQELKQNEGSDDGTNI